MSMRRMMSGVGVGLGMSWSASGYVRCHLYVVQRILACWCLVEGLEEFLVGGGRRTGNAEDKMSSMSCDVSLLVDQAERVRDSSRDYD